MKRKGKLASTGHGTGALQAVPLGRSALLRNRPRCRQTGAARSEREIRVEKRYRVERERRQRAAAFNVQLFLRSLAQRVSLRRIFQRRRAA